MANDTATVLSKKLQQLKDSKVKADIFMSNGIKLTGIVMDYDDTGILLSSDKTEVSSIGITRSLVSTAQEHSMKENDRRPNK